MMHLLVRPMRDSDLAVAARIHAAAFPRQMCSREWIECNARAFPRLRLYVAELQGKVRGFVMWAEKSGFRKEAVLELEQIAVDTQFQKQGIGAALIVESLPQIVRELAARDARLKHVLVTTRADNDAQRLYRETLGAKVEATLPVLYSADEVFMVARDPLRPNNAPHRTRARASRDSSRRAARAGKRGR